MNKKFNYFNLLYPRFNLNSIYTISFYAGLPDYMSNKLGQTFISAVKKTRSTKGK